MLLLGPKKLFPTPLHLIGYPSPLGYAGAAEAVA